ncbi:hypothetical protein FOZG_17340 [Fusarium oxysporum Fo47]|uniref:Uncharacterized protein n=1 Tax=Fusarium oxysporum Fo47 TaxID=660027 RepID=W9JB02_FUSOX|nr:hypothetical protein FOZG_17340 [Fusarium oxysporum Fo47]
MRTGLWMSGATGSGVLVARNEDNDSWSPPSGILLNSAGIGFLAGAGIYDCVIVINNRKALDAFTGVRATIGVFTYLKSRGFYAGIQVNGTVILERTDENERFYGEQMIGVSDILGGYTQHPPETKMLMEALKAAEGPSDFTQGVARNMERAEG